MKVNSYQPINAVITVFIVFNGDKLLKDLYCLLFAYCTSNIAFEAYRSAVMS